MKIKKEIIIKIKVDIEPNQIYDYIYDLREDLEDNFFDWQSSIRSIKSEIIYMKENYNENKD